MRPATAKRSPLPTDLVRVDHCVTRDGKAGLCKVCGWPGHRVPRAWLDLPPATPYPGRGKLIGATVRLRGEVRPVGDAAAIRFVIPFDSFKPEVLLGR